MTEAASADPKSARRPGVRAWFAWLSGLAAVSVVVGVTMHLTEEREFLALAEQAKPSWLLVALVLQAATYAAQSGVLLAALHRPDLRLPFPVGYQLSVAKLFVDQALPSVGLSGDLLLARVLTARGVPRAHIVSAVAVETVSFYAAYVAGLALALTLLALAGELTWLLFIAATALVILAGTVVGAVYALAGKPALPRGTRAPRFAAMQQAVHFLREADSRLLHDRGVLARAILLQAIIIALDTTTLWALLIALGIDAKLSVVFPAFMVASLFRSVGFVPGGLGTFEASAVGALSMVGIPLAGALAATLLFRGLSFWLPMAPGLYLSRRLGHPVRRPGSGSGVAGPYWTRTAQDLAAELHATLDGLAQQEAERRLEAVGPNVLKERGDETAPRVLWRQIRGPLQLLLLFAAAVAAFTGEWFDAAIVLLIVSASAGIGFTREFRAQNAAAQLRRRVQAQASVMRDGRSVSLPHDSLVPGDVFSVSAGSLVPADAVLIQCTDLQVEEAVLTGESFPASKGTLPVAPDSPLSRRSNCVFAGTHVRSGSGRCLVIATAMATELGSIAHTLQERAPETEFDRATRRFGVLVLEAMTFLLTVILVVNLLLGRPLVETLLFSIALAVGLSPELLPAILSVNLARGAQTMARRGVLVRRLNSIENLGSMDVLCTDKTGTLTEGVVRLDGAWDPMGRESPRVGALAATNAALQSGLANPLDVAILADPRVTALQVEKLGEIPYDFERRRLSVIVRDDTGPLLLTKGASKAVLAVCEFGPDGAPMSAAARAGIVECERRWAREGTRVLGVASARIAQQATYGRECEARLRFEGFVTFLDRPKEGVGAAIGQLAALGVCLKIVTGDSRDVAQHVAREVGLGELATLSGPEIDAASDDALRRLVEVTGLFAEVNPHQKERIVRSLQGAGHVVGFLGDGINDTPAMHAADASLSVESAVDIAREAADFVLLERQLDVIRQGIEEGRRTLANTLKYILTTMSANLGNMVSMAIASLFLPFLPLLASQVLLNNFLSDIPALGLANDRVDREWLTRPHRWDLPFIRRFMVQFGILSSLFDCATFAILIFGFTAGPAMFRTGWFVESLLTELAVALVVRTERPFWRSRPSGMLLWSSAGLAVLAFMLPYGPWSPDLGFVPLPATLLCVIAAIVVSYVAATELLKRWFYGTSRAAPPALAMDSP
ncbi:MAG: magnesium-translocating P-type ATPase [Gammaproteobacteria bacterium]|nr:magnesium-translocating P-type ATPase [Gammaproteobacteria bacterium]